MQRFIGQCVRGPFDGQWLAHWSKTKEFFRPMMSPNPANIEASPIISVKIGEYKLNDYQQWHWWETPEGNALRVLDQLTDGDPLGALDRLRGGRYS